MRGNGRLVSNTGSPFFHENLNTLFDFLPNSSLSFDHQWEHAFQARHDIINDHYKARVEFLPSNLKGCGKPK